jgi:hypothetical protein
MVVAITILILGVRVEFIGALKMSATEHQGGQVFFANGIDGKCMLGIGGVICIPDGPVRSHVLDFCREECWDNANDTEAAVGLEGLDVGKEFWMVCVIVDAIMLVVCKEAFIQCYSCHDTLSPCIIGAAETLDEFEEANDILVDTNGRKSGGGLEVVFEIWGALMINFNVGLAIFLSYLSFRSCALLCLCFQRYRSTLVMGRIRERSAGSGLPVGAGGTEMVTWVRLWTASETSFPWVSCK